jgi:hypothetical protein
MGSVYCASDEGVWAWLMHNNIRISNQRPSTEHIRSESGYRYAVISRTHVEASIETRNK